jgi:hypothetical protein
MNLTTTRRYCSSNGFFATDYIIPDNNLDVRNLNHQRLQHIIENFVPEHEIRELWIVRTQVADDPHDRSAQRRTVEAETFRAALCHPHAKILGNMRVIQYEGSARTVAE